MNEKRTLTLAFSPTEMLKTMYAESAWNELTTIASIPPIRNATDEDKVTLMQMLRTAHGKFVMKFAGYIENASSCNNDEDIWTTTMLLPATTATNKEQMIREQAECAIVACALETLYSSQFEAKNLRDFYRNRKESSFTSLRNILATM